MELVVGVLFAVLGALVIWDSHRVGAAWAADGPQSGYFPNIIGWILVAAGAWVAGTTVYGWRKLAGKVFVTYADLRPVLTMLVPTIAYVVLIRLIGIYVASAIYIAGFMLFQGKYKWLPTLCVSVGVPVAIFLLFEVWFLVPLPKGPLEQMLGY
ncbi:MAG: tripartite tricarboxylate transporter TctB family protein [Burkholderiales bacterium]|nr:tripartite tricarboxylate transporter TctB family protein [Burkholderiales bacterium]